MLTGFCLLSGFSSPSTSADRFQMVFFVPKITEVAALRHKRITPSQQQWRQGITDHMNLGSLLRSAAFFGVEGGPKGSHEGWRWWFVTWFTMLASMLLMAHMDSMDAPI